MTDEAIEAFPLPFLQLLHEALRDIHAAQIAQKAPSTQEASPAVPKVLQLDPPGSRRELFHKGVRQSASLFTKELFHEGAVLPTYIKEFALQTCIQSWYCLASLTELKFLMVHAKSNGQ